MSIDSGDGGGLSSFFGSSLTMGAGCTTGGTDTLGI